MRTLFGFTFAVLVLAAVGYTFHQLVLKPASALSTHHLASLERMPPPPVAPGSPAVVSASGSVSSPAVASASGSEGVSGSPILPLPVPPKLTPGDLIAVLEHGSDDQAAAAIRELVEVGEPSLAPLTAFQTRWRSTMTTLQNAEAEMAATGDSVDLSGNIRKASLLVGRSTTAIREINKRKAEQAIKVLKVDAPPPPIPAADDGPPPIPAANER